MGGARRRGRSPSRATGSRPTGRTGDGGGGKVARGCTAVEGRVAGRPATPVYGGFADRPSRGRADLHSSGLRSERRLAPWRRPRLRAVGPPSFHRRPSPLSHRCVRPAADLSLAAPRPATPRRAPARREPVFGGPPRPGGRGRARARPRYRSAQGRRRRLSCVSRPARPRHRIGPPPTAAPRRSSRDPQRPSILLRSCFRSALGRATPPAALLGDSPRGSRETGTRRREAREERQSPSP